MNPILQLKSILNRDAVSHGRVMAIEGNVGFVATSRGPLSTTIRKGLVVAVGDFVRVSGNEMLSVIPKDSEIVVYSI